MGSPQRTTYGDLSFDATLSANHVVTMEITDFPVEEGANPSDHIRTKPQTVSLDVVFSTIPLGSDDPDGRGEAPPNNNGGFARQQLERLHGMIGQALPLVMPWWKSLSNMAIASIGNPVTAAVDGFMVKVDFKQIRFVSSATTRFEKKVPTKIDKKPTVKSDQGKKLPTPESERNISHIASFTDAWDPTLSSRVNDSLDSATASTSGP